MKSGKLQMKEGIELPNQEKSERLKKRKLTNTRNYWKRAQVNKWRWKKEKKLKEYLTRTRKLHETKLYSRNLIKRIITWAVPFLRYSGPFLTRMILCWSQHQISYYSLHRLGPYFEHGIIYDSRGACGVMVIIVGNEHGDTSSNHGRDWLHFT